MQITLKTLMFWKETVLKVNHVNREINILDITIEFYRCYGREAPSGCNTAVYLSCLLHSEDVLGVKVYTWWVHTCENEKLWL